MLSATVVAKILLMVLESGASGNVFLSQRKIDLTLPWARADLSHLLCTTLMPEGA
jgi:hypothetical protein